MSEGFVKKLYKTADAVNYIFGMACRVRSPMERGTLEIKCYLQSRFPPIFHMQPHMLHCNKLTAARNNDLSRLHMISFKQPKTPFLEPVLNVSHCEIRKHRRTKRFITGI